MEEKICQNCIHFLQHYIKSRNNLVKVNSGYCNKMNKRIDNFNSCYYYLEIENLEKEKEI